MAKFSMKQGGKEVGSASVYAQPHTMDGKPGVAMELLRLPLNRIGVRALYAEARAAGLS